jgi:septal ring factor EnvC (AmiA/AmiB activator)
MNREIGKSKEKKIEAELSQSRSKFASLQSELLQRTDEASRVTAELRISVAKRDEALREASGMKSDVDSVQRDFARLFKVSKPVLPGFEEEKSHFIY